MLPLLSIIVDHVFGVYDGNVEVLQRSADGPNFELLHCVAVVSGRDSELLDIGFFMIRGVGVRSREHGPSFCLTSPVPTASPISAAALAVAESKKSAGIC